MACQNNICYAPYSYCRGLRWCKILLLFKWWCGCAVVGWFVFVQCASCSNTLPCFDYKVDAKEAVKAIAWFQGGKRCRITRTDGILAWNCLRRHVTGRFCLQCCSQHVRIECIHAIPCHVALPKCLRYWCLISFVWFALCPCAAMTFIYETILDLQNV